MDHDDGESRDGGGKDEWERLGLEKRIDFENLRRVFERLDLKRDGKIDKDELQAQYEALDYKPRKQTEYGISEVEDVIWEVRATFLVPCYVYFFASAETVCTVLHFFRSHYEPPSYPHSCERARINHVHKTPCVFCFLSPSPLLSARFVCVCVCVCTRMCGCWV